jgi:hypothetical protein
MKATTIHSFRSLIIASVTAAFLFPGTLFSQKNDALKLVYDYPQSTPVKYLSKSKMVQNMDINGQTMVVSVDALLGCTVAAKGKEGDKLLLEIKIDTLVQSVETPGANTGGVLKDAIGKVFNIKILNTGKEVDLVEAQKVSYTNGQGAPSTMDESFSDFFPDLPAESITPGYTWSSTDTLNNDSESAKLKIIVKAENKFEGYEQVDGLKCAKISFALTGSRELKTQTQGMDIKMTGPLTGSGDLFFSAEKGYFIKETVITKTIGQIEITSPENMSFPVTVDQNSVVEVIK